MKITLLNVTSKKRGCLNKDTAGGFGTVTKVGDSFLGRILEYTKKRGVKLPIVSLGYLAAIFSKAGHEVEYGEDEIPDSDLVIIPSSIVDYRKEREMAREIKEKARAKVGFIGPFASLKPEIYLKYCDFVIKGEPEGATIEIAKGMIPEGLIKSSLIEDLDSLPFPNWDPFPISRYSYSPPIRSRPFLTILSSRGCPLPCRYYCPYVVSQGQRVRRRSVGNVIEEIKYLIARYKIRGLMFRDPIFTFDKERAKEIARRMMKENITLKWGCETHLDFLDLELVEIMYEAGLRTVEVGIESVREESLKDVGRRSISRKDWEGIINHCERKGIKVSAFYILGLPSDTKESIEETMEYAKRLNTHGAQFTIFTPYPGTPFYEENKERLKRSDWEEFDGYTPILEHENLYKEELLRLKEKAFVSYYYRVNWLKRFIKGVIHQ